MKWADTQSSILLAACVLLAAGIVAPAESQTVVFEGARLINGEGGAPIENAAFMVEGDRFTALGRRGELTIPAGTARVDLSGKTVIPALIDAHVHMGYRKGLSFGRDNYTRENLLDTLNRFAYYGVAAILETGTARSDLAYQLRAERPPGALFRTAGRGFGMPDAGPGGPMRDSAYGVTTEAETRMDVQELAAKKVDMIKIWVDDRNGTVEKLKPGLYRAIIEETHKHDIHVLAHIVDLVDVKDLLRAGVDGFAHMIRDKDIDDELLGLLKARPNVFFQQTYRDGAPGDAGGADPDASFGRRHPHLGADSEARPARHGRGRQERRFSGTQRQPAGQHRQHAKDQQGLPAWAGSRPCHHDGQVAGRSRPHAAAIDRSLCPRNSGGICAGTA
jgi:hypothetical protein